MFSKEWTKEERCRALRDFLRIGVRNVIDIQCELNEALFLLDNQHLMHAKTEASEQWRRRLRDWKIRNSFVM